MITISVAVLQETSEGWSYTTTRASSFAHDFNREGRILTIVEECADGSLCDSVSTELKDVFVCENQQSLIVALSRIYC